MGNFPTKIKVNFECIQKIVDSSDSALLINVMSETQQECLILNTVHATKEEEIINLHMRTNKN